MLRVLVSKDIQDSKIDSNSFSQCNIKESQYSAVFRETSEFNDLSIETAPYSDYWGYANQNFCYNVCHSCSGHNMDDFSETNIEQVDTDPAVSHSNDEPGSERGNAMATCNRLSKYSVKRLEEKMLDLCSLQLPYPDGGNFLTDISNNIWQLQELITSKGGSLQTRQSEVILTIKQDSVENSTAISGSVLIDIPFIRKKFNLKSTHIVVAPAVEYHFHDETQLTRHACLELPHCMSSRKVLKMQVWWCANVGGNITKHPVPHAETKEDIYWMKGTRPNTINVFAKHFCVILCTACEEDVEFDIRALLFHKFGDVSDPLSLTILLQLGGPLSKIRDFERDIKDRMKAKHLTFVEDANIDLIPQLEGVLKIYLEVIGRASGSWVHMKRANGDPVYESEQHLNSRTRDRDDSNLELLQRPYNDVQMYMPRSNR
ncbi:uncharacterized protein LOC117344347 isoform X2 [Pecten maximus]|uniref:uncharacterized protein LOC117344347 isoform X2 n=1 Tax=Pecten maximus TaxID=6579 RepID=UPI0014590C73|nr:uncharacterized protein LOC117344347 isoform X2 [Pecten maximus]